MKLPYSSNTVSQAWKTLGTVGNDVKRNAMNNVVACFTSSSHVVPGSYQAEEELNYRCSLLQWKTVPRGETEQSPSVREASWRAQHSENVVAARRRQLEHHQNRIDISSYSGNVDIVRGGKEETQSHAGHDLSIFVSTLFSQAKPVSWESDTREPFGHIAVNIFETNGSQASLQPFMSTAWYNLPLDDFTGLDKRIAVRGQQGVTPATHFGHPSKEEEYILVQLRKFNDFQEESLIHLFVTRLSLNIFVVEVEAVLKGDSRECDRLGTLASLLASLGSVEEPSQMRQDIIPLLIVALITESTDETDKTKFETTVYSALKHELFCRVHLCSSSRVCYYVKLQSETSTRDNGFSSTLQDDGILRLRSSLKAYAKMWKPDRTWASREIVVLRRGRSERSVEAKIYVDYLKSCGLSESDIQSQLRYFHDKGVIFYPQGLRTQHIIFDIHWLCTLINSLHTQCPTSLPPHLVPGLANMRKLGVTNQDLVFFILDQEVNDPLGSTLLSILDHYVICLQPQARSIRSQPMYVDSGTAPPSRISAAALSRANVVVTHFLPARLPKESRPEAKVVAPLAIRGKGGEIPHFLYLRLSYGLLTRFPIGWQLSKIESTFCVEPGHVLIVTYNRSFIVLSMEVQCRRSVLSPKTAFVCNSVRQVIEGILQSLKARYHLKGLIFCFGGLKGDADENGFFKSSDFIGGTDPSLSFDDLWRLYDENGRDYIPSDTFYLWFSQNDSSPGLASMQTRLSDTLNSSFIIKNEFPRLCAKLDVEKVLSSLSEDHKLTAADVDYCRQSRNRSSMCMRLLRVLDERGPEGEQLLQKAVIATKQHELYSELWPSSYRAFGQFIVASPPNQSQLSAVNLPQANVVGPLGPLSASWNLAERQRESTVAQAGVDNNSNEPDTRLPLVPNPSTSIISVPTPEEGSSVSKMYEKSRNELPKPLVDESSLGSQPGTSTPKPGHGYQSLIKSLQGVVPGVQRPQVERRLLSPDGSREVQEQLDEKTGQGHDLVLTTLPSNLREWVPQSATLSQSTSEDKGDPQIHPIFEAKYYHIERATDRFDDRPMKDGGKRLGSGSFGTVYYGILHSETGDKFEVAIKRLKKASSLNPAQVELSRKQFGTEMNILTRYVHVNIVRLIGFSSDGPELCLIYEFMRNGALSHRLDCKDGSKALEWKMRLQIAEDVATGIIFLHTKYRQAVVHRDVTSSNVLLDGVLRAKLAGFGLASLAGDAEQETSPLMGTKPYMPPEAFLGIITTKIDVYGFGMILYELATGLLPYCSEKRQDLKTYIDEIKKQNVDLAEMLDSKARFAKRKDKKYGLKLLDVAQSATIKKHTDRPSIDELLPRLQQVREKARRRQHVTTMNNTVLSVSSEYESSSIIRPPPLSGTSSTPNCSLTAVEVNRKPECQSAVNEKQTQMVSGTFSVTPPLSWDQSSDQCLSHTTPTSDPIKIVKATAATPNIAYGQCETAVLLINQPSSVVPLIPSMIEVRQSQAPCLLESRHTVRPIYRPSSGETVCLDRMMQANRSNERLQSTLVDQKPQTTDTIPTGPLRPVESKVEPEIHPLERATDHLSDQLGKEGARLLSSGRFWTIYHIILYPESGTKFEFVVKRLEKAPCSKLAQVELAMKQFKTEIHILTTYLLSVNLYCITECRVHRYSHHNLMTPIGSLTDGPELCLFYEYMKNGSLCERLNCKEGSLPLNGEVRLRIAGGVASGLDYLHDKRVIHRNVKSSNVLIDTDFEAKLSGFDFGSAIFAGNEEDNSFWPLQLGGTRPYLAPEALDGLFTTKMDVYSFGMIIYELATGLPPYSSEKKQDLKVYIDAIIMHNENPMKMLDPKAKFPSGKSENYGLELLEIAQIATLKSHADRPSISNVVSLLKQLERATVILQSEKS
jgi:interleukin-1 receptor-associated kinase 4